MEQFTADIQELNSRHSFIGEELAGELSNRFPRLQHAFSAVNRDDLAASGVKASSKAEVIALLPLDSSADARQALENAFQEITATGAETIVVDMDIADPHSTLLAHSGGEGLSDHFLYGVSPEHLLTPGPEGSSLKVVSPGTFTPRAEEIYTGDGWNELIDSLSSSNPEATLLLVGPPAEKFPSLSVLSKTGTVIVLSGRLDNDSQQKLPATLEHLEANLSEDAQLKLIWLDTEPPVDEVEEPEAEEIQAVPAAPVQPKEEAEPALTEDEEQPAETEELPEETAPPVESIEESEESSTEVQQPDSAEITVTEESKISAEIDGFLDETKPPAEEPALVNDSITQLKADGVSLDNEKLPGQQSLEDTVDDGAMDDTFSDLELPGLNETSSETANVTPQDENDDEEIFLPDELLFLDEDDQTPPETTSATNEITEDNSSVTPEELPESIEIEAVAEPEAEADDSAPEIPDLSEIDVEEILPSQEESTEPEELPAEEISPEQDEAAEPTGEPAAEIEAEVDTEDELDADALFSDDDLDDEDEDEDETPPAAAPGTDQETDEEALALIEKFRETSDQSQDVEPDLALDDDPLGDGADEQDSQDTEAIEMPDEPADTELDATAVAETETVEEPEAEPVPELEAEPVVESDAEPELDAELDEAPETETEEISDTVDSELSDEETEPEDEIPVDADLIDITEGDAPLEAEMDEEESAADTDVDAVEEKAEAEAGVEPEAGEEVAEAEDVEDAVETEAEPVEEMAELDADELEEIETGDLESLDDEITTTTEAEETAAAPPDSEEETTEELEEISAEDELDVPADDELDELLSGTDDIDDLDGGITLDNLDEIDDVQPAAKGKKARKKKAASKSKNKPVALLVMLIVIGFGLFFVWKQGYVSKLVRQVPALTSIAGFIPGTDKDRQQEDEAVLQAAADSARLADSLSMIPPPPQYDKLGYSIQIGSYRYLPQALAIRDRLVQNGFQDVYVVPLVLDSLGNWNRLYLGMYRSAGRGDTALLSLAPDLRRSGITDGASGGAITRHTPLTLMVAEANDPDSLQAVMNKLEVNHIPAYMIQVSEQDSTRPPLYRLYSGAFENESQAVFLRERIFNIGVRATVVEREGPAEQEAEQQEAPAPPV
jgi:hypothetical protein